MQEVFPEVVNDIFDGKFLGIRYDELIPVLIDSIQKLKEKMDSCKVGKTTIKDILEVHAEHERLQKADNMTDEADRLLEEENTAMLLAIEVCILYDALPYHTIP